MKTFVPDNIRKEIIDIINSMPEDLLRKAKKYLSKIFPVFEIKFSDKFKQDFSAEGYILKENIRLLNGSIRLRPVSFLETQEKQIVGRQIIDRAIRLNANLGQLDAEKILDNQNKIPEELRPYMILFPGTVWVKENNKIEFIPCLKFKDGYWSLDLVWLGFEWTSSVLLLASCEISSSDSQ